MIVKTSDGHSFLARDERDLIRLLHEVSLAPAASDEDWMQQTAERTETVTGEVIRTNTPGVFVSDLARAGLIKIVKEDDSAEG